MKLNQDAEKDKNASGRDIRRGGWWAHARLEKEEKSGKAATA